jgi:hypothetical protein
MVHYDKIKIGSIIRTQALLTLYSSRREGLVFMEGGAMCMISQEIPVRKNF